MGATLYAALTGVTPEDSLARAMGQAELTSVRKQNSHVSRRLASAIEKSLELLPDDRYQTPDEFKQALLNASSNARKREGDYVVAPPPDFEKELADEAAAPVGGSENARQEKPATNGNGKRPIPPLTPAELEAREIRPISKPLKRSRRSIGCLVELVVLLIIVAFGAYIYRFDQQLPATIAGAVLAGHFYLFAAPHHYPDDPWNCHAQCAGGTSQALQPQPQGSLVGFADVRACHSDRHLYASLLPTATVTVTPLPTPIGGATGQIAFASKSKGTTQIFVINSDGTGLQQITNIPEGACQPDFSPDTQRIIFTSPCDTNTDYYVGSSLYIMNIDGTGFLPLPTMVGGDYDPGLGAGWQAYRLHFIAQQQPPRDIRDRSGRSIGDSPYPRNTLSIHNLPGRRMESRLFSLPNAMDGEDIWVMDADGKNQKQFTYTTYQLTTILPGHPTVRM